jgi:type IV pilus assembly protein PilB
MKLDQDTIKKILLEGNYVTTEDVEKAESYAKDHGVSMVEYLLTEGLISDDIIGQAIAESFGLPYSNLKTHQPSKEQVLLIPEEIAKEFRIVLFSQDKKEIIFATDEPKREDLQNELSAIFPNKKIIITFSLSDDIDSLFIHYQKGLETQFSKLIESEGRVAPEIVDQILEDALLLKASDIHCEPEGKDVVIRFRIDGILHDAGRMPKEYY